MSCVEIFAWPEKMKKNEELSRKSCGWFSAITNGKRRALRIFGQSD
jgi:hypothetical protein